MDTLNFKEWLFQIQEPVSNSKPVSEFEIIQMYFHNPNLKVRDIALKANTSVGEVYRVLHRHGTPNRQITNHEHVKSFARSGFSVKKIAEFTGYTPRNIRYILKKD